MCTIEAATALARLAVEKGRKEAPAPKEGNQAFWPGASDTSHPSASHSFEQQIRADPQEQWTRPRPANAAAAAALAAASGA